ncbi:MULTISPECIES: carbohydrate ABC transporter permease [Agrobacterium]|uniref:Sugar ABC transporter permease n=2 Tax=Agrobacterium TaxID=357 RepID=A0A9X3R1N8_9HYPH|nr:MULTISPECIES: sugar ABC transporter permease [Agrobacterium]MCZ7854656.1 sugar ABC transporter permease [Agrobacterium salinitolerans]MCZ7893943.1 sugar ABC transporter permease [Agrobacterium salinitolerans]MCZ7939894.1 sugar ABC transporter permease [Agrobacterium salinitolerans]NSL21298.1 sugar ABC transporter permease [Agrobacterium tumefaciens]NSY52087.1 sugar ABC transporter permease [Agrobacterium tumefaciens]
MSTPPIQAAANPVAAKITSQEPEANEEARLTWAPYLWFAPAVLILFLVTLYPTAFVAWLSFQKTKYYELAGFVGLANYQEVLTSPEFWDTTLISLIYVFGSLAGAVILGMAAALLLNNAGVTGSALRVFILFPWTLSMSVVGSIWLWLLNPSFGPIPYLIQATGFDPGLMLGDPGLALPLITLVTAWWSFPYVMVMATAAMQSIPKELYEAVEIDGGGALVKFRYVTLTHIMPTLGSAALTLSIIYLTLMTLIIVMTGGGPLGSTTTLSFEAFRGTIQAVNIGPTAVVSIVVLFLNVALGALYTRLTGRVTG